MGDAQIGGGLLVGGVMLVALWVFLFPFMVILWLCGAFSAENMRAVDAQIAEEKSQEEREYQAAKKRYEKGQGDDDDDGFFVAAWG